MFHMFEGSVVQLDVIAEVGSYYQYFLVVFDLGNKINRWHVVIPGCGETPWIP